MKLKLDEYQKNKIEVPDAVYENLLRVFIKSALKKEKTNPQQSYNRKAFHKQSVSL
ncbi:hypothetical protein [Desulfoscipio geothermicus]|uniref:Uncharacterized protein n=1 Tax=Desulfoscipio geothermicus DSM 3669 TaxID=1121426 RepID=A0A1I6EN01_9FIRM|nr:hypothetical protein [Desulfoscipio geothermicus]SFR18898.1 hypothetical protein SAMN05660706_1732 [Desulfoscipio geothermicus DSM 3669]